MWFLLLLATLQGDRMIAPGGEVGGIVSEQSTPVAGGRRAELYGFRCVTGREIRVDAISSFDNVALILAPNGATVAQDDDGGGLGNARLQWRCPDNQLYRIGVAAYHVSVTGAFTLRVSAGGPPATSQQPLAFIAPGSDRHGELTAASPRFAGHPIEYFGLRCRPGLIVQAEAISRFDNLLYVFGASGPVAFNDDANATGARVVFECPDASVHRIGVAGQRPEDLGPFRLSLLSLSPRDSVRARPRPLPGEPPLVVFPGARVDGLVPADAPLFEGRRAVFYALECQPQLPLRIEIVSPWDNMAWVVGPSAAVLARNDDADGTNARIEWTCPDAQVYRVGVGAIGSGGGFALGVQATAAAPVRAAEPRAGTLFAGARVRGNLQPDAGRIAGRLSDVYDLQCTTGAVLRLEMTSRFDNVLAVMDTTGRTLAFNDDAQGTNAGLTWTCPDARRYRVAASARTATRVGPYLLRVSSP